MQTAILAPKGAPNIVRDALDTALFRVERLDTSRVSPTAEIGHMRAGLRRLIKELSLSDTDFDAFAVDYFPQISKQRKVISQSSHRATHDYGRLLLIAPLSGLQESAGRAHFTEMLRHKAAALPIVFLDECPELHLHPQALQTLSQCVRLVRDEPFIAPSTQVLRRLLQARQANAEKELIANATTDGDRLIVWSCEPKRYEVQIADVPELLRLPAAARSQLQIEPGGSYIHWPEGDVNIGMELIRELTDPHVKREHEEMRRQAAQRLNKAMRAFREEQGILQTGIPGLSDRQVRRLEQGDTMPHSATLAKLAAAHGLELDSYLAELAKRSVVRRTSRSKVQR